MIKTFKHYSSWLLLMGISISLLSFLYGTDIYRNIKYALAEVNEFQYKYSYYIDIHEVSDVVRCLDGMNVEDGNLLITEQNVLLDKDRKVHLADIILKQNEDFPFPVDYIAKGSGVIIGKSLEEFCTEENGVKKISIDGKEWVVIGLVQSPKSDYLDYKIIFSVSDEEIMSMLSSQKILLAEYGSNKNELITVLNDMQQKLSDYGIVEYESNTAKYIEVGSENSDEQFYIIIAVFAMINCVVISEFWIIRRKNEIKVRKICGFSNARIFALLYKEMLSISMLSAIGVFTSYFIKDSFCFNTDVYKRLGLSIVFMLVCSFVLLYIPMKKVSEFTISEGLEG